VKDGDVVDKAVSMSVQETVKYTAALHRPAHRQPSIQTTANVNGQRAVRDSERSGSSKNQRTKY